MADTAVNSIVSYLKENEIIDSEYKNFENDLLSFMFHRSIYLENVKNIIPKLKKYITDMKIKSKLDISVLTLKIEEADRLSEQFDKFDNLKLSSLREFTTNPDNITKKIEFCQTYGIPYQDENGVLFQEITDENNGYYLRGYYVDPKTNKSFKDFDDFEKFIKVCAYMQKRIYASSQIKLLITKDVEELIKNNIIAYPDLSESQIANSILTDPDNSLFSGLSIEPTFHENVENNLYHRNGR